MFWCWTCSSIAQIKKKPFRPPETFHFAVTAWLDSTEHRLFSVLQIRLVAVIERLLLIRNQCKTPAHAAACSLPSADRGGTFLLTGLTLALCGCISLRGGTNPYSCHIYSQVLAGLLFFSAAVCRNARKRLITCDSLCGITFMSIGSPQRIIFPWRSITQRSAQQVLLFAVRFGFAVKWGCHRIGGTESLSTLHRIIIYSFPRQPTCRFIYIHSPGVLPGKKIWCHMWNKSKWCPPSFKPLWCRIKDQFRRNKSEMNRGV